MKRPLILVSPECFPESVVERIREIADAHPAAECETTALGTIGGENVFADLGLPDADALHRASSAIADGVELERYPGETDAEFERAKETYRMLFTRVAKP